MTAFDLRRRSPTTGNMDVLESPTDVSALSSSDGGEHFESDTQPEAPPRAGTEITRQQPGSVGITRPASQTPTQPVITSRPSIELSRPAVQQQQQPLAVAQQAPVVKSSRTDLTRPAQQQQTHAAPQQQQAVASRPSIERIRPVALQQQQQAAPATNPPSLLSLDTQGSETAAPALQQTIASWLSSENLSCSTSSDSQVISVSSTARQQTAEPLEMHTKPRPEPLLPQTPPADGASDNDSFVVHEVALPDRTDFGSTTYRDAVIGVVSDVQDASLLLDRLLLEADQVRLTLLLHASSHQLRSEMRKLWSEVCVLRDASCCSTHHRLN